MTILLIKISICDLCTYCTVQKITSWCIHRPHSSIKNNLFFLLQKYFFEIWWKFSRRFILYSYLLIHSCSKEHQNYFGIDENLGPVAVSIRREKVEDAKEKEGSQFNYRIVFRTSELTTLRGAILEDAIPSTARHGTARGLPLKEVLEYVIPELSIQCLRQASSSPKVPEQLLKLDEQGVCCKKAHGLLFKYYSLDK